MSWLTVRVCWSSDIVPRDPPRLVLADIDAFLASGSNDRRRWHAIRLRARRIRLQRQPSLLRQPG
jgi:hypothetical protein